MSAQDPSFRFLDLPPELRNIIYTDILTSKYRVELPHQDSKSRYVAHKKFRSLEKLSTRLSILRVSKLVYHEAKQLLYQHSTFAFNIPSQVLQLVGSGCLYFLMSPEQYRFRNDHTSIVPVHLMQNITISIPYLDTLRCVRDTILASTVAVLGLFSGRTIRRTRCTVKFLLASENPSASPLLKESFLGALNKMICFETTVLSMVCLTKEVREAMLPSYEMLNKRLGVKLGPGEKERSKDGRVDSLTYHPRRYVEYQEATLVRHS